MGIRSQHRLTRLENVFLTVASRGNRLFRAGGAENGISLDLAEDGGGSHLVGLAPGQQSRHGDAVTSRNAPVKWICDG